MRPVTLGALALALLGAAAPVAAQDALAGKRLYLDVGRTRGSGVSCVDCHGGLPGAAFGIGRAANDAVAVERAVNSIPQMAALRGRLSGSDYADLAAFIGRPDVPSPLLRTTTAGAAARTGERLDFGAQPVATSSATSRWRLANDGALLLRLSAAPVLRGEAAADFAVVTSECAAGRELAPGTACSIDIVFRPGALGVRRAAVAVAHDWVGGEVALALDGEGTAAVPPATTPPIAGSAGGGGVLGVVVLGVLAGLSRWRHGRQARSQVAFDFNEMPCHEQRGPQRTL